MSTEQPTSRSKWHLKRWFIVFVAALFAWSGWRVVDQRSAIKEARALGWLVNYTDPGKEIRADWDNAFRKATWTDGVTWVDIPTSEAFQQHVAIVHRLNPQGLGIADASTLRDLSAVGLLTRLRILALHDRVELTSFDALKNLPALESIDLSGSPRLTNLDGLKHLSTLNIVVLDGCTGLTNVDELKSLPNLRNVYLKGCTGLTRVSVDALYAALPKAIISPP